MKVSILLMILKKTIKWFNGSLTTAGHKHYTQFKKRM